MIKDRSTDLCRNGLLQTNFMKTFFDIRTGCEAKHHEKRTCASGDTPLPLSFFYVIIRPNPRNDAQLVKNHGVTTEIFTFATFHKISAATSSGHRPTGRLTNYTSIRRSPSILVYDNVTQAPAVAVAANEAS